jgi:thiosulfate/3-mercaptopyruvate sulfurtransferase
MTGLGPLVDIGWLTDQLWDPRLRLADCRWYLADPDRGRWEYETGHLPGGIFVSLEDHLTGAEGPGRHPLPDPGRFAKAMGELGIGDTSLVVAYDDGGGAIASRLWWMLTALGHHNVAVLDGGIAAWSAAGGELTTEEPEYGPTLLTARPWHGIVDRDDVARLPAGSVLVDARAPDRFRGEVEPIDPVAGHIPGSINLPYAENLDGNGSFRDAPWLRARYLGAHADGAHTVVYCGSGVTACHNILAMEVAGLGRATLYPGSWSDWATAGMPVESG